MTVLNKVPNDAVILVCDARKALLISNAGSPVHPRLQIDTHFEAEENTYADAGGERSGRRYDGGGTGAAFRARSAMEASDPDAESAAQFASQVLAELTSYKEKKRISQVLVVAPPPFLGLLRTKFSSQLKSTIMGEVPKNLTDMPIEGIQKTLIEEW